MEAWVRSPTSDISHVLRYFPNAYSLIKSFIVPHVSAVCELSGWPSGLRRQTASFINLMVHVCCIGTSGLRMEAWVRIPLLTVMFCVIFPMLIL